MGRTSPTFTDFLLPLILILAMTCVIYSRAGQALSKGRLFIEPAEDHQLRLVYVSNNGNRISGGIIGENGDLEPATQELFDEFFRVWGMTELTMTTTVKG